MKIKPSVLIYFFLLLGFAYAPIVVYGESQTSIEFVVLEDEEIIEHIEKKPLENDPQQNEEMVMSNNSKKNQTLPKTNEQKKSSLSVVGLVVCLGIISWICYHLAKELE